MINALRPKYSLKLLLQHLVLSKSSYFYQQHALEHGDKYAHIRLRLQIIFKQNYASYGYRRMKLVLADEGINLSEKVIRRLMKEEKLQVSNRRYQKYNSYAGEISPAVPNLLKRDFHADKPNQKWVTDITEFTIQAGKIYLSPIIDCFDGQIVSWSIGKHPNAELANSMLSAALATLKATENPIIHSDRGAHSRWPVWIQLMKDHQLPRSMSKKGYTPDNAQAESFFGHLKTEFFYTQSWLGKTDQEFMQSLDNYIHWYNTKGRKISLEGKSLSEYRHSLNLS